MKAQINKGESCKATLVEPQTVKTELENKHNASNLEGGNTESDYSLILKKTHFCGPDKNNEVVASYAGS